MDQFCISWVVDKPLVATSGIIQTEVIDHIFVRAWIYECAGAFVVQHHLQEVREERDENEHKHALHVRHVSFNQSNGLLDNGRAVLKDNMKGGRRV